jgi:hypothetical protein
MSLNKSIIVVLALAFAGCVGLYIFAPRSAADAGAIVNECAKESDSVECYERVVPALYPAYSIPEVFDILREIRTIDPTYQFCHVLSHKLGEKVVAENPAAWIDAIPLNPGDGMCSNGFIHGVVGGRFRADVLDKEMLEALLPDFRVACEARPKRPRSGDLLSRTRTLIRFRNRRGHSACSETL